MSYEYCASVHGCECADLLVETSNRLINTGNYCPVNSNREGVHFRFSSAPVREEWPEDFSITLEAEQVLLTIYSASREQRTEIVLLLEKILRETCGDIQLDEI